MDQSVYEMTSLGSAIINPIEREVLAGKLQIREGRIHFSDIIVPKSPWIRSKADNSGRECGRWLYIYFKYYKIIPKECFGCWKIICRIDKLSQLVALKKIQEEGDIPSKVGVEDRGIAGTSKKYIGIWYAPLNCELTEAREIHKKVESKVQKVLGMGVRVNLKRACTEMEYHYGPSDAWTYKWEGLQKVLDEIFVGNVTNEEQPRFVRDAIFHRWIEVAWENGDPSVWEFAKKEHFPAPAVFYERSIHSPKDFSPLTEKKEEANGLITELQ